jgi:hypothetical protein
MPTDTRISMDRRRPSQLQSAFRAVCVVGIVVLGLLSARPAHAQVPTHWFPTGPDLEDYAMGGNPAEPHGVGEGGFVRSAVPTPRTFAAWATTTDATPYLGRRLRFSSYVRTESVANHAVLWMRVDGVQGALAFDDMNNRPIKGTTGWKRVDVVLDVPTTATGITYGLILMGKGKAWFDGVTVQPVGTDVPTTATREPFTEYLAGNYGEAAQLFPDRIAQTPTSFSLRLFQFLALQRNGQADDARAFIARVADRLTDRKWAGPVVLFYAGRLSEDDVLKAAASVDPVVDQQRKCEAYYYLAMAYLLKLGTVHSDSATSAAKVQEYLKKCVATGVVTYVEYRAASEELQRLRTAGGRS